MCNSNLVDEIELQAQLLQNKIADIIEGAFAREMNRLVYDEARKYFDGCDMDDLSYITNAW